MQRGIRLLAGLALAACGPQTAPPPPASAPVDVPSTAAQPRRSGPEEPLVLVAYYSETGMTRRMAGAVAEGARAGGARVVLAAIDSVPAADLLAADAIILGSPTHWANMATRMRAFIDSWPELGLSARDRIGAAFATGAGSSGGKEMVLTSMILAMLNHGMIVVGPIFREGNVEYGNFGVAAATGPMSSQSVADVDLDAARALGRRVAEVAGAWPRQP